MNPWLVTVLLALTMQLGLFLLLWGAVGFLQDKRFFGSAPKEIVEAVTPKKQRFPGQHLLGVKMIILALVLLIGPIVFGVLQGVWSKLPYWMFLVRFLIMFLGLKAFDILFFDYFLLCHSSFFPHYYPEVKDIVGPHLFGYNKISHLVQILILIGLSFLLAYIGILFC